MVSNAGQRGTNDQRKSSNRTVSWSFLQPSVDAPTDSRGQPRGSSNRGFMSTATM